MGFLSSLLIRIGADTRELGAGLDKATRDVRRFGQDLQSAGMALTASISLPLIGVAAASLKATGEMEQTEVAFRTLLKSADAAKAHLEDLKKFTLATPYQFQDVTHASRLMQAYGTAVKDVIPNLRTLGNAASALGLGAEGLERIIRSVGEIGTRGKITGEQIRELSRAGIPALEAIAKATGVSVAKAQSMITAGMVDAKVATDALMSYMETRFGGGMEAQSQTMLGIMSNLKDRLTFTLADIGKVMAPWAKQIMNEYIEPMLLNLRELAAGFAALPQPVQAGALALGGLAVVAPVATLALGMLITNGAIVGAAFSKLVTLTIPLTTAIGTSLAGALGTASIAYTAFSGALVITGVIAATAAIYKMGSAVRDLSRAFAEQDAAAGGEAAGLSKFWDKLGVATARNLPEPPKMETAPFGAAALAALTGDYSQLEAMAKRNQDAYARYMRGMQAIAIEHGKNIRDAQGKLVSDVEISNKALEALGVKSTADRKKELEAAKANYAALVKAGVENGIVLEEAAAKVQAAQDALYGITPAFAGAWREFKTGTPEIQKALDVFNVMRDDLKKAEEGAKNYREEQIRLGQSTRDVRLPVVDLQFSIKDLTAAYEQNCAGLIQLTNAATQADEAHIGLLEDLAKLANYQPTTWGKDAAQKQADIWLPYIKDAQKEMNEFEKDAHRVWNSMTNSIARNIVEWKGWKDTVINIGKDFATGFLSIMLKKLLEPLEAQFAALAGKIGGWLGGLLGNGGGAVGAFGNYGPSLAQLGATGASVGSAAAGAASGAGKAAGSLGSVMGIVGAVGSAISAVTGIIGNFQSARQETTLNAIEQNTRYISIATAGPAETVSAHTKNTWMVLLDIRGYLWGSLDKWMGVITGDLESGRGGGGGGSGTFQFYNCNFSGTSEASISSMMQAAFRQYSLAQGK